MDREEDRCIERSKLEKTLLLCRDRSAQHFLWRKKTTLKAELVVLPLSACEINIYSARQREPDALKGHFKVYVAPAGFEGAHLSLR